MKLGKLVIVMLFGATILSYFGFDSGGSHKSKTNGLTSIVIYSEETFFGNADSIKAGKLDQYRMNQWIVNAATNNDNLGTDTTHIVADSSSAAVGKYDIHWHVANGPNPRLWFSSVYHGGTPTDASNTGRVTFWIKAKPGSHQVWFWLEDASYNGNAGQSARINISGARVFSKDTLVVNEPFNGQWQFVSIPWSLISSNDTSYVKNAIPGSWTRTVSAFDKSMIRHTEFDTDGGNPPPPGGQGWVDDYYIDQIQFIPTATGITGVKGKESKVPVMYSLNQNYPNPFNPTTTISYNIPSRSQVTLTIYNMVGQKIRTLVSNKMQEPGAYSVQWDSRNNQGQVVPSGVYLYRIEASHFVSTKKMVLLK